MLDGVPRVGRDGLSLPFRANRDDGVLGMLPAVCAAKVLVPVLATGRAETPDPWIAFVISHNKPSCNPGFYQINSAPMC